MVAQQFVRTQILWLVSFKIKLRGLIMQTLQLCVLHSYGLSVNYLIISLQLPLSPALCTLIQL